MSAGFRAGFVTILGRPNTGKSTLVNALVGSKVAIVTHHPQTTRTHLLGIVNRPEGQIVLVDTPGVHRGRGHLSREMLRSVRTGLEGRDLCLFMADITRKFGAEDQLALDLLREPGAPAFLLLNKVDLLPNAEAALPIIEEYKKRHEFAEVIPISALKGKNLDKLVKQIIAVLPEAAPFYPEGQATDQPEQFMIAECIREQAMLLTREEVPHTLAVRIERDEVKKQRIGQLRVLQAVIICERPGQKAILIGKSGEMIRQIGTAARQELEMQLDMRVFLELHVLVRDEWRNNPRAVAELDFRKGG